MSTLFYISLIAATRRRQQLLIIHLGGFGPECARFGRRGVPKLFGQSQSSVKPGFGVRASPSVGDRHLGHTTLCHAMPKLLRRRGQNGGWLPEGEEERAREKKKRVFGFQGKRREEPEESSSSGIGYRVSCDAL